MPRNELDYILTGVKAQEYILATGQNELSRRNRQGKLRFEYHNDRDKYKITEEMERKLKWAIYDDYVWVDEDGGTQNSYLLDEIILPRIFECFKLFGFSKKAFKLAISQFCFFRYMLPGDPHDGGYGAKYYCQNNTGQLKFGTTDKNLCLIPCVGIKHKEKPCQIIDNIWNKWKAILKQNCPIQGP